MELPSQKIVLSEGQRPAFLHVLMDGTVELFVGRGGRESSVILVQKETPFILAAVVKDAPYLMSARTLTDCRILYIPALRFRSSMRHDPGLSLSTACEISDAYRTVVRQLREQRLRSAKMRLANYLVDLHRRSGGTNTVRLEISKRRLASLLGLKPESLSRVFAELAQHGVLVNGEEITVTAFELLEDLAQYDRNIDSE
jgi:CRP/FNR family transcriptional activator FtrB